jgi:hypothetical protein
MNSINLSHACALAPGLGLRPEREDQQRSHG